MPESVRFAEAIPVSQKGVADRSACTGVDSFRFRLDNAGEVVSDYSYEGENLDSEGVAPRRKRVFSRAENLATLKSGGRRTTSGRASANERQKTTRACDACKTYSHLSPVKPIYSRLTFSGRRKSRCSGTLPCHRCNQLSILCKYESPHRRGQPPSPPRETLIPPDRQPDWPDSQSQQQQPAVVPSDDLPVSASDLLRPEAAVETLHSSRSSPARDATNVEGQYIGPTSGLAFLHRAKGRLRQDFSSSTRNGVDNPRTPSSIFTFGDKPYPNYSDSTLVLPSRQQAREHVKRYFEFAIPTYRFLHQGTVEGWLEKFMDENDATENGAKSLTDGKAAVVLMVLATSTLYRVDEMAAFHDAETEEYDQR